MHSQRFFNASLQLGLAQYHTYHGLGIGFPSIPGRRILQLRLYLLGQLCDERSLAWAIILAKC
jgi:hypothetical protein